MRFFKVTEEKQQFIALTGYRLVKCVYVEKQGIWK